MILLYSFEGTTFRYGGNSCEDTPVPMPNTEVKLTNAESTWLEAAWEDRTAGGKSPCGSTFSDHHMESLTFQLHLLDIEILQILRPLRSAAHEDKPLTAKTGLPFIRN